MKKIGKYVIFLCIVAFGFIVGTLIDDLLGIRFEDGGTRFIHKTVYVILGAVFVKAGKLLD